MTHSCLISSWAMAGLRTGCVSPPHWTAAYVGSLTSQVTAWPTPSIRCAKPSTGSLTSIPCGKRKRKSTRQPEKGANADRSKGPLPSVGRTSSLPISAPTETGHIVSTAVMRASALNCCGSPMDAPIQARPVLGSASYTVFPTRPATAPAPASTSGSDGYFVPSTTRFETIGLLA